MRSKEDLLEIARMAKLSLAVADVEPILGELGDLMDIVEPIRDVDLSGYDCSDEAVFSELREDVIAPSLPVDLILSDAAEKQNNFFTV